MRAGLQRAPRRTWVSGLSYVVVVSFVLIVRDRRDAFSSFFGPFRQTPNLSLSRGGDSIHHRQVDLTDREFLGQKTGGVTRHSKCDSCRPTAAILGAHGASGPVRCVPPPHGSCRASSCGLEYMDVWHDDGPTPGCPRVRWALSSEEKYFVTSFFGY